MKENVFQLLERQILHHQHTITVEVYGSTGTQMYKGYAVDVPLHICWSYVESWDMENYHMTITVS